MPGDGVEPEQAAQVGQLGVDAPAQPGFQRRFDSAGINAPSPS
jgi:hypothetical protein